MKPNTVHIKRLVADVAAEKLEKRIKGEHPWATKRRAAWKRKVAKEQERRK